MDKLIDFVLLISTSDQLDEQSFLDKLFKFSNQQINSSNCSFNLSDKLSSYPFKLDNKYYNANIKFITLNDRKEQLDSNLIDNTEVLSILFDLDQENCLTKIEEIYSKFDDDNLQEKILIYNSMNDANDNDKLLEWCCKNRFELINLNVIKEDNDGDSDYDYNNNGFRRFIEVLDTHSWSTIQFKRDTDTLQKIELKSENKITESNKNKEIDHFCEQLTLNDNDNDLDNDNTFEDLLGKIKDFKEKSDQLTGDDKYNYAEKVAMAFLNSLDENDD